MIHSSKSEKPLLISYLRFSTAEQLKGHSLKRQLEKSEAYAKRHGLTIDEKFNLKDMGVSAFRGDHRKKGALGALLELIKAGEIPPKSVLLIESFDRLSREKMLKSITIFADIVSHDIKIVTLIDGREYDRNSNQADWIMLVSILGRANEESETKSIRLKEAWKEKRANIKEKKLTALSPAWLKLSYKTKQFQVIPERAALIRRIFQMNLDGYGIATIAKNFNEEKIPAWKSKSGWHSSYISKILHNKAVIGKYELHVMDGRKRISTGKTIDDYFPAVVDESVFQKVQEKLRSIPKYGGRNGKISNLFGHIARCGYCGSPMRFIYKGAGDRYLICDSARRGCGCDKTRWNYKEFEQVFLKTCENLDVKAVLPAIAIDDINRNLEELKSKRSLLTGELRARETQRSNLIKMLSTDDDDAFVAEIKEELKSAVREINDLKAQIETLNDKIARLSDAGKRADEQRRNVNQLIGILQDTKGDDLVEIRRKLRGEIRKLVKTVDVFPNGLKGRILSLEKLSCEYVDMKETDTYFSALPDGNDTESQFKEYKKYLAGTTGRHCRCFAIRFQEGGFREVIRDGDAFQIGVTGTNWHEAMMNILNNVVE